MSFLVTNCFQWVGFHIVNHLIENGYRVDGLDEGSDRKKENLSMMIGRNDLFSLVTGTNDIKTNYTTVILNGSSERISSANAKRTIYLCYDMKDDQRDISVTTVKLPLLFGEWMPMNEKGMYHQDRFVPFDSDDFLQDAVYIDDVITCLMQLVTSNNLPASLEMRSANNKTSASEKAKDLIYLRDESTKQENLKQVLAHYDRFKDL